jgi:hypothetical protein
LLGKLGKHFWGREILMNGCYDRETKDGLCERAMKILCTEDEARKLLDIANRLYPDAAEDITRSINVARAV